MTKEQERILQHEVDAGWAKGIPKSAKRHMQHKPFKKDWGVLKEEHESLT